MTDYNRCDECGGDLRLYKPQCEGDHIALEKALIERAERLREAVRRNAVELDELVKFIKEHSR